MYLRCNTYTYTRVKGGYGRARHVGHVGEVTYYTLVSVWPPSRGRASSFVRGRRGRLSLSRPPMGVVPSSNRDYGLRRGRCSPRAPRTRILYLPRNPRVRSSHTCADIHRVLGKNRLVPPGNRGVDSSSSRTI